MVLFGAYFRCWTLSAGARRATMDALLDLADIVVMTEVCHCVCQCANHNVHAHHVKVASLHLQTCWPIQAEDVMFNCLLTR